MKNFSLFILLTFIYSCTSQPKESISQDSTTVKELPKILPPDEQVKDTTVVLIINGESKVFTCKTHTFTPLSLLNFQKFLTHFNKKPLEFKEEKIVDVTGDGEDDKVITHLFLNKGECFKVAKIFARDSLAWSDSVKIDEDFAFSLSWNRDSVYFQLKPYSLFYEAWKIRKIMDDEEEKIPVNFEGCSTFFLQSQEYLLKQQGLDSLQVRKKINEWKQYLENYKGKVLLAWDKIPINGTLYIWDKQQRKFIHFYRP